MTLSNKYYLEALESYPFCLSETLEYLNYALSYDSEHAGAHCLMAKLYMEQLKEYPKAEHHFEQALVSDINHITIYEYYSLLLIYLKEYERAINLIKYAYNLRGINIAVMLHREGLVYEAKKKYKKARKFMNKAYKKSCDEDDREFFKKELDRVKCKFKEEMRK